MAFLTGTWKRWFYTTTVRHLDRQIARMIEKEAGGVRGGLLKTFFSRKALCLFPFPTGLTSGQTRGGGGGGFLLFVVVVVVMAFGREWEW